MKGFTWGIVVVIVLSLVAGAFGYGALSQTVNGNSKSVVQLNEAHQKTLEVIAKIDKNQALLTQRLEEHLDKH